MFSHVFSKKNEYSPIFEISTVPFRLHFSSDFITIEYQGKSYRPVSYTIKLCIFEDAISFMYTFTLFNNTFSIPLAEYILVPDNINSEEFAFPVHIEICTAPETAAAPFVGFENFGATCYINSLLQTVYHLTPLKTEIYKSEGYMSYLMQRLVYTLDRSNQLLQDESKKDSVDESVANVKESLYNFVKNLDFVKHISEHQDVHEFSKFLFEALENDNKAVTKTVIEGQVVSIVECECGCVSKTKQSFQDLQMVIKDFYTGASNRSVYDSLQEFCRPIDIDDFTCEKHGHVKAKKRVLFSELPSALFLLLNRFTIDWTTDRHMKINEHYAFPEELDFSEFMDTSERACTDERSENNASSESVEVKTRKLSQENEKDVNTENKYNYRLFSVIVHTGSTNEGHFYCYLYIDGKYYKFNDECVNECSKYEAVDWNFGGRYAHKPEREKHFSAYYLVYCNTNTFPQPRFDYWSQLQSDKLANIAKHLEPISINYFDTGDVVGYAGPGRFNINNVDYPAVPYKTAMCYEIDNLSKLFHRKALVYDSDFKIMKNKLIKPDLYYISSSKKQGTPVFIKIFTPGVWCTFPSFLYSLGEKKVSSLTDFSKFTSHDLFDLYIDNYNENLDVESNLNAVVKVQTFDQIKAWDSLVITPKTTDFLEFIRRFYRYNILNISIENLNVPIFVERGIDQDKLGEKTRACFHTNSIEIKEIQEKNRLLCTIPSNHHVYCVGIGEHSQDINLIEHLHFFILQDKSTVFDLLNTFKHSTFLCMSGLQNEIDLCVVESHKRSTNARILDKSTVLEPMMEYLVIQKVIQTPIKVSFYKDLYDLINYPFFIENPGTIKDLRMKYFFANRIVKFNGSSYIDCLADDVIILEPNEILLIEKD